jgi:O-antigen/teichoic acid export membrane protein
MKLSFVGFVGMIALNFILIPTYGLIGAALSTTIVSCFLMLSVLVYTNLHFHAKVSLHTLFSSFLGIIIISLATRFLPHGTYSFILSGAFLFFFYFGILKVLGELKPSDIAPFQKLFNRSK